MNLTKQPNLELCFLEKENEENQKVNNNNNNNNYYYYYLKGLFISHVHSDDPSGSQGDIRCGDRILEVTETTLPLMS